MKKFIMTAVIATSFFITLTACNSNLGDSSQAKEEAQEETPITEQETTTDDTNLTITSIDEDIDPYNLKDGTYHVSVDFSEMINHNGSVVLDFGIYLPVHYDKGEIEGLKKGQTLHVHWGETDDESRLIQVETVEVKDKHVAVNGGLESDGVDLVIDDSGYYRVVLENDATYYTCRGFVGLTVPETVDFEDSYATPGETRTIKGSELYNYFSSLSDDEKTHYTQNCTFLTIKGDVITEFYRVYVP